MAGIGSSFHGGIEGGGGSSPDKYGDSQYGGGGGGGDERQPASSSYGGEYGGSGGGSGAAAAPEREVAAAPKKGMVLGLGKSKKQSMMDKLASEDGLGALEPMTKATPAGPGGGGGAAAAAAPVQDMSYPVMISLEEKISAALNREGALEQLEIKGTMNLTATVDEALNCKVQLAGARHPSFAFQTHPKVDKKGYEGAGQLGLKAGAFPKAKGVGVLRWSMSTTSEDQVPISINCWPEPDGGDMNVNVEFTADKPGVELHDVRIVIPLGTAAPPQVVNCDTGTHRHNRGAEELVWEVDLVDGSNKNASLEFNVAQRDADAFFPIAVSFRSKQMNAGVDVAAVVHAETGAAIQYNVTKSVTTETYKVE